MDKSNDDKLVNANIPATEVTGETDQSTAIDEVLKQSTNSEDSDTTLPSEHDAAEMLAMAFATPADGKEVLTEQTLDYILKEHTIEPVVAQEPTAVAHMEIADISQAAVAAIAATSDAADAAATVDADNMKRNAASAFTTVPIEEAEFCNDHVNDIDNDETSATSIRSIGSFVCRICHNSENLEKLVSPCLCKGSLTYVHIYCLERWISTSRSTTCEVCQFQYNTQQTLRYTCYQSLRMWYSRSMSRRALQEDCQMFSLLTLVAFGIIGTLLVGIQYYVLQGHAWGVDRIWTKGWLIFFLFTTLAVYFINIYMIVRSQLSPWYRWWQSARDIKLILENRKPFHFRQLRRSTREVSQSPEHLLIMSTLEPPPRLVEMQQQQQQQQQQQLQLIQQQEQQQQQLLQPQSDNINQDELPAAAAAAAAPLDGTLLSPAIGNSNVTSLVLGEFGFV